MEVARNDIARLLQPTSDTPLPRALLYIGITCGLSAPYVAAQFQYLESLSLPPETRLTAVVLGFNPRELARDLPIEGSRYTFRQILDHCLASSTGRLYHNMSAVLVCLYFMLLLRCRTESQ
jgi:hypothetical protein